MYRRADPPQCGTRPGGGRSGTPGANRDRPLRRHVGLVFQYPEHQLFAETVAADIAFGLKNRGVEEPERSRRVRWGMDLVGLAPELCDRSPFHLSGGQMRRVAIAGVLALEPDILILDEPSAGLDPEGEEELFALLKKLHQQGKTIVLVTHDMNHVVRCADRVFVLADGKLVLSGTPEEVFSRSKSGRNFLWHCRMSRS